MEYRNLGGSGLVVSEIGLGSWLTLGSSVDRAGTREIVQAAYDLGVNFFDTADVYAQGEAEKALGKALASLPRPHVVIATKCFFPMSEHPNDRGLSRKHIFESVEGSLRRLGGSRAGSQPDPCLLGCNAVQRSRVRRLCRGDPEHPDHRLPDTNGRRSRDHGQRT